MNEARLRALCLELGRELRTVVLPELGSHAGRAHVPGAGAAGGDITFAIDEQAEGRLASFLAERAPELAFYSEDRGMVVPGGATPEWVLVVDPIDGTRPAMAGFESACVSIAAAPLDAEPTMGDVTVAVIVEIKTGAEFVAVRGGGVDPAPNLSTNTSLETLFWTYGLRGRPARPTMEVLGDLIDTASVGGGTFDLGSATYDMTRINTGQLDAYVEPGPRLVDDVPGMRAEFERVGRGAILNNSPYDLAAAALCLEEAGGIVTDAYGQSLGARPLLGSGAAFQMSCVATANSELHRKLVSEVEAGIERLSGLVESRAR